MDRIITDQKMLYDYALVYHTDDIEWFPNLCALKRVHLCTAVHIFTGS